MCFSKKAYLHARYMRKIIFKMVTSTQKARRKLRELQEKMVAGEAVKAELGQFFRQKKK